MLTETNRFCMRIAVNYIGNPKSVQKEDNRKRSLAAEEVFDLFK